MSTVMGRTRASVFLLATAFAAALAGFTVGARSGFSKGYALAFVTGDLDTMYMARINRREEGSDDERKKLLELWVDMGLVTALQHGDILDDVPFYAPADVHETDGLKRLLRNAAAYRRAHPSWPIPRSRRSSATRSRATPIGPARASTPRPSGTPRSDPSPGISGYADRRGCRGFLAFPRVVADHPARVGRIDVDVVASKRGNQTLNERASRFDSPKVLDTAALVARFDDPLARGPTKEKEMLPAPGSSTIHIRKLFSRSRRERREVDVSGSEASSGPRGDEEQCEERCDEMPHGLDTSVGSGRQ
jgi:hypothetical protein